MKRVFDYIDSLNINKDDYIIVACSGGPDSMFLLHILNDLGYRCICAHVNHKVRIESDFEYEFVKEYCNCHDIIFEGRELPNADNVNFENYAREFRYKMFKDLVDKYNAKYVFTAHHGDDLVETVLMRLVRGSSLKGYRGFDILSKKENYYLVRPLIFLTKDVICEYLDSNNIKYVIDSSNESDDYTRNRYRHYVLPFLKSEDKDVHLRFLKYNETLFDTYNYIERVVNDFLSRHCVNGKLDLKAFKELDPYIKVKVLEEIFRLIFIDDLYVLNKNHVDMVLDLINSSKVNSELVFINKLYIVKSYDVLEFILNKKESSYFKLELKDKIILENGIIQIIDETDDNSNYVIRLNSKDIKMPLYIRSRLDGDKMEVKNMNGSKKINDIFIDMKIDTTKRDTWPILVDSNDVILWLPGLKKSKFDVLNGSVYDIIVRYEKGENSYE